jgi:hypothetical protein
VHRVRRRRAVVSAAGLPLCSATRLPPRPDARRLAGDSTTFDLNTAGSAGPLKLELTDATKYPAGTKVLIKCGGNSAAAFDSVGALLHTPDECVLDGAKQHRVLEIVNKLEAEVELVGITLRNGYARGGNNQGASILTTSLSPNGRLKLTTKFVKLLENRLEANGADRAGSGGGAYINQRTDYVAKYTIFEKNVAERSGGAVFLQGRSSARPEPRDVQGGPLRVHHERAAHRACQQRFVGTRSRRVR